MNARSPFKSSLVEVSLTKSVREVVFIDARVENWQTLVTKISPAVEVVVLAGNRDGVQQIADWAATHTDISAMHLIGHGSAGNVQLGTATLNAETLNHYEPALSTIGNALTAEGDLLLYGCDVGSGAVGATFIQSLVNVTGADIAASSDLTGATTKGGDWVLETAVGAVEAQALGEHGALAGWDGALLSVASFAPKVDYATGTDPYVVTSADVNGDGKVDLITANTGSSSVSVLMGNGDGSFAAKVDYATGANPYGVTSADVNSDGKADLITANASSSSVSVLMGNGDGSFRAKVNYAVGGDALDVTSADVNGDGKADLVAVNLSSSSVSVLMGNGDGSFAAKVDYATGFNPYRVTSADVNGDGKADLITANASSSSVSVLMGNGDGSFAAKVDYAVGATTTGVTSTDVNGDGNADLITANFASSSVSVLMGNGDGSFAAAVDYTVLGARGVTSADVNGDGNADLITANISSSSVSVLMGNGDGSFAAAVDYTTGASPSSCVTSADVNGDGKADLIAANYSSSSISVLINTSDYTPDTNQAPVNTVPTEVMTVFKDTPLVFRDGVDHHNAIKISDADAGPNDAIEVTLTATHGTLTLNPAIVFLDVLGFTVGTGTNNATMTFSGTQTAINAALNGLVFTPSVGYSGTATIDLTTNDLGHSGTGGPKLDTDTVRINLIDEPGSPTGSHQLMNQHQTIADDVRADLIEVGAFFATLVYGDSNLWIANDTFGQPNSYYAQSMSDSGFDDKYSELLANNYQLNRHWDILTPDLTPYLYLRGDTYAKFTPDGLYCAYISAVGNDDQYHTVDGIVYGNSNALLVKDTDTLVLTFRGTDGEDASFLSGQAWSGDGQYLHYEAFRPLIEAALAYAADPANAIKHIVVSGHSLGGAMVDIFTAVDAWRFAELSGSDLSIVGLASAGIDPGAIADTNGHSFNQAYDHSVITPVSVLGLDLLNLTNPSDFYFGAAHNQDRVFFPTGTLFDALGGYYPNDTLAEQGNVNSLLMNLPNIDNGDVNYGPWSTSPRGFGAHHNSAIYWHNLEAYLNSSLLPYANQTRYQSQYDSLSYKPDQKLIFGVGTYADPTNWFKGSSIDDKPDGWFTDRSLIGTTGADFVLGLEGDDVLQGNNGNDLLDGGAGDDKLYGDDGDDYLAGGAGQDFLIGGSGTNTYVFQAGDTSGDRVAFGHQGVTPKSDDIIRVVGANFMTLDVVSNDSDGGSLLANQLSLSANRDTLYVGLDNTQGADVVIAFFGRALTLSSYSLAPLEWYQHLKAIGTDISIFYSNKAADGYLSGASIYLDENSNGIADSGEDTGIKTDSQGNFTLASEAMSPLIAIGGINIDTGLANPLVFTAPIGAHVVNPITTLVQTYIRLQGGTIEQAQSAVKAALHIASDIDLCTYDPLGQPTGDTTALFVQQQAAQLATLATLATDPQAILEHLVAAIVAHPAAVLDLSNAAALTPVLGATITPDALSHATEINLAIGTATDLEHLSAVQKSAYDDQNDAPLVTHAISDQSATTPSTFSFALPADTFTDLDAGDTLSYRASKADGSALPTWLSFNAATQTFSGTPQSADIGVVDIKVIARDVAGAEVFDTFTLAVTQNVNVAPVNTIPASQVVDMNGSLVFDIAHRNALSVTDADAGANPLLVTLTATHGTLTLSGIGGLSFSVGDGVADTTMTFTGTQFAIDDALNGLVFAPSSGYTGAATIQIATSDQGNSGSGGAQTDTDTVNLTVASVSTVVSIDGVSVTTSSTTTDGLTTTIHTIDPVSPSRIEDPQTGHSTLADIPLATDASGNTLIQIGLPTGVGVESSHVTGNDLTLRQVLIDASTTHGALLSDLTQITSDGIDPYVSTISDQSQVTVRALTLHTAAGSGVPNQPIVITGTTGTGEGDAAHPFRQEALVIDARQLPAGSVIELNQVEFAIIIGAATVTGGTGRNIVIGDGSVQTIILGVDDDILHGGGGNDTIGSRGGNDQLYGDAGNDLLVGGMGNDLLIGGSGDDILQGGQSDAGTWTFKLNAQHQLISSFTADDSRLAQNASETIIGAWNQSTSALTANGDVGFANQDIGKLEVITLLYQALIQQNPDLAGMDYWANQNYTEQQLANLAYTNHIAQRSFDTLDAQASDLIGWLWGAPAVTDVLIKVVTDYISAGGAWADGVLAGIRHANFRAALEDSNGNLNLIQRFHQSESGWSADTGNDNLNGGDGNDTLIGGRGNNTLDGGNGIDTAQYSGTLSDYRLAQGEGSDGNPFSVIATNGNGSDVLNHIERLQFADTKIAIDLGATDHASQAMEFIGTIAPTLLGNTAVRGQILSLFDAGDSMQALCQRAIDLHLVPTDNTDLATTIYQNVLAQAPTAEVTQTLTDYIDAHGQVDFLATVAGMALNIDLVGLQQTGVEYV